MAVFTLSIEAVPAQESDTQWMTLRLSVNTSLHSRLIVAMLSSDVVEKLTREHDLDRVWQATARFVAWDVERFVRAGGLRPVAAEYEPLQFQVPAEGVLQALRSLDDPPALAVGALVVEFEA